jgi:hypothetical protein
MQMVGTNESESHQHHGAHCEFDVGTKFVSQIKGTRLVISSWSPLLC